MKEETEQTERLPLSRIKRAQKAKRPPAETIAFRLDVEYLKKLDTLARKRGNSIHKQAREMLMALLDGDEAEFLAMRVKLEEMEKVLKQFTGGMADTMEAILMMNGASEEKARSFIGERLRRSVVHQ